MRPRVHIVGAGLAGLSAALACARAGAAVTVYEAAPQAGGRARTITAPDGFAHDNGTHVLFTANRRALRLIETVGASGFWVEPEQEGIPMFDALTQEMRRVGLSPWSWLDRQHRPKELRLSDVPGLLRLTFPMRDRPVGTVTLSRDLVRALIGPLTAAVLNTPPDVASSERLGTVLRRLARPGSARLLVARRGLGPDLIAPAVAALDGAGGAVRYGHRLRGLVRENDAVTSLAFADEEVPVTPSDRVILALPPMEVARLLPELAVPRDFEPILNVHFRLPGPERPRFIGLLGTLTQWVLIRRDHASVTVSAARSAPAADPDVLAAAIWAEIAPALAAAGIALPSEQPDARVVTEKRATIRQAAGGLPQPPVRPLRNLALAGDWIGRLPATIESAVVSGERAARIVGCPISRRMDAPKPLPLAPAGGTP